MIDVYGTTISKEELLQYAGRMDQIAGVELIEYSSGRARGVRAADLRTGSGLRFSVLLDRGMDIGYAEYSGKPLSWICKNGVVAPEYFENGGLGFLRSFTGGLTTTCGLTQVGDPGVDGDEVLGIHGRISHTPADTFSVTREWAGDDYILAVSGKVRETCLYAENMTLERTIQTKLGSNTINITDTVTNAGYNETPFMFMYHINFGFPVVSEYSRLYSDADTVEPWFYSEHRGDGIYDRFDPPTPDYIYQCFLHHMPQSAESVKVGLVNEKLNFGAYVRYSPAEMPSFNQWKMMGQQDYVVALEPGINIPEGRIQARENNRLRLLKPGESRSFSFSISVLPDADTVESFTKSIKA